MRPTRLLLPAAAVALAVLATAACSTGKAASSSATTAAATTTTAAAAEPVGSSASPTTWAGPDRRDPRAGTDKAVLDAKPVVTTTKHLALSESEQRAAAAWANKVIHASHLDLERLPVQHDPNAWTKEMTPTRHAAYARSARTTDGTFGGTLTKAWGDHMRATKVERYVMSFEMPYRDGRPDFGSNVTLLRASWLSYSDLYASPTNATDMKARNGFTLLLGVVRGPDAARPFQISTWEYLDQDKNSRWYIEQPDGSWAVWKS